MTRRAEYDPAKQVLRYEQSTVSPEDATPILAKVYGELIDVWLSDHQANFFRVAGVVGQDEAGRWYLAETMTAKPKRYYLYGEDGFLIVRFT